jgi:hypothetical protein
MQPCPPLDFVRRVGYTSCQAQRCSLLLCRSTAHVSSFCSNLATGGFLAVQGVPSLLQVPDPRLRHRPHRRLGVDRRLQNMLRNLKSGDMPGSLSLFNERVPRAVPIAVSTDPVIPKVPHQKHNRQCTRC